MVAEADLAPSETDVAVSVTVAGFGIVVDAVYVMGAPGALNVPERTPHVTPLQPEPESAHLTPWFLLSPFTVAVKLCAFPI